MIVDFFRISIEFTWVCADNLRIPTARCGPKKAPAVYAAQQPSSGTGTDAEPAWADSAVLWVSFRFEGTTPVNLYGLVTSMAPNPVNLYGLVTSMAPNAINSYGLVTSMAPKPYRFVWFSDIDGPQTL